MGRMQIERQFRIDLIKKKFQESYFRKKTVPKLLSVLFGVIFWLDRKSVV
jgi:hypothetical protein